MSLLFTLSRNKLLRTPTKYVCSVERLFQVSSRLAGDECLFSTEVFSVEVR